MSEIKVKDCNIVHNAVVYDLKESIIAAGYPMRTKIQDYTKNLEIKDWRRANGLLQATVKDNQAHGQFMTGIRVAFDLTFSNKAWVEMERYRFMEFISSESTLHKLAKFDFDKVYNDNVDPRIIEIMKGLQKDYNENPSPEAYLKLLYSNPCGFKLTARLTTNYRCLRNIYHQRKTHRLPEWREFCKWLETLPEAWLIVSDEIPQEYLKEK